MPNKKIVFKDIAGIEPVLTGHGVGEKRVLLSQKDHSSPITQIAQTSLKAGEIVEGHVHPTMDEHFVFLEGECVVTLNGESIRCKKDHYLLIPAGTNHEIKITSNATIITIGVAKE